jgi:pSer/pThr/pTyr-binding forkhead associated (FHA) protein
MPNPKFLLKKLPDGPEIVLSADVSVGRSPESALKLVEGNPSRHHAMLSVSAGSVFVEDLGSTNGTYINDQRIDAKVKRELRSEDRIRFDVEEFILRVEGAALDDRTVLRPGSTPKAASGDGGLRPGAAAVFKAAAEPVPGAAGAVPRAAAEAGPKGSAQGAPRAAGGSQAVAGSGSVKVPAGWVDDRSSSGEGTAFMTPEELDAYRQRAVGTVDSSAGQVTTPVLIVRADSAEPESIQLQVTAADKNEWTVGSADERDVRIKRPGVSALHAKIVKQGNRWRIIDQVSSNGTFVNGKKCMVGYLSSGDRIAFGSVVCTFRLPAAGAAARAASGLGANLKTFLLFAGLSCLIVLVLLAVAWKQGWL